MIDITDYIIGLYEKIIPVYVGKESAKDLTKEDVDKFIKEYLQPMIHKTACKMVGWTDEDTRELEKYSKVINNQ